MSAENKSAKIRKIKEIYIDNVASRDAEQELLDYMIWTMKLEKDPHDLYDDPIEVFRKEMAAKRNVA